MTLETLQYLADKLGIAIDWAKEDVYPQIVSALDKIRGYRIGVNAFIAFFGLALIVVGICLLMRLHKDKVLCIATKRDTAYFEWLMYHEDAFSKDKGDVLCALAIIGIIVGATMFFSSAALAVRWAVCPEIGFFQMIRG